MKRPRPPLPHVPPLKSRPTAAPHPAQTLNAQGQERLERGDPVGAEARFRHALGLLPHAAPLHANLGVALHEQNRLSDAEAAYRAALGHDHQFSIARRNLAACLREQQRLEESRQAYLQLLASQPDDAEAHLGLAFTLLMLGAWPAAWREYTWRWLTPPGPASLQRFASPPWDGAPLPKGSTLLLHHEQGLGDTLMMLRYLPSLAEQGLRVIAELPPPLFPLAPSIPGLSNAVLTGDSLPPFTAHLPFMSLPGVFATTPETLPPSTPPLLAEPSRQAHWGERLNHLPGRLRVGLTWSGSRENPANRRRVLRLADFAPLAGLGEIDWISLQVGAGREELAAPPAGMVIHDWGNELGDFADTAALLSQLDLILTLDSAVAHLAGIMHRPALVLLPFIHDWRWHGEGESTPWYSTLRLLRQPTPASWEAPMARARQLLSPALLPP